MNGNMNEQLLNKMEAQYTLLVGMTESLAGINASLKLMAERFRKPTPEEQAEDQKRKEERYERRKKSRGY